MVEECRKKLAYAKEQVCVILSTLQQISVGHIFHRKSRVTKYVEYAIFVIERAE